MLLSSRGIVATTHTNLTAQQILWALLSPMCPQAEASACCWTLGPVEGGRAVCRELVLLCTVCCRRHGHIRYYRKALNVSDRAVARRTRALLDSQCRRGCGI